MASRLLSEVQAKRPDLYQKILHKIQPHSIHSVLKLFEAHLRHVDLDLFNQNREAIPEFVWAFIQRIHFPTPGDAFGILLTCRITKADTQGTLDSKHLQLQEETVSFNVEKAILDELNLFSTQIQVFELANRRRYATVFLEKGGDDWLQKIPEAGELSRGGPFNKGKDAQGRYKYLSVFRYIIIEQDNCIKVLYQSSRDLFLLLRHLPMDKVVAFSDVRYVFQKCGIVSHYFNMVHVVQKQLLGETGSVYERDLLTIMQYQCRSGTPLPLTRDGLAKNPDRSPIEVLSFEAPKKNYSRLITDPTTRNRWHEVETSSDKIFFGQQFNEGTGYSFALLPKNCKDENK